MSKTTKLRVAIFPLTGIELEGEYKISDHINLSGKGLRETGFVAITDLYQDKNHPEAIIVACIPALTQPSKEETQILLDNGVKAFCYDLIEPALYAAANGQTVEAVGFVPKLASTYSLAGISAGIKITKKKDIGIIHSEHECLWAGVFTKNNVKAACVTNNQKKLGQKIKNIFVNSGNANACTGEQGNKDDLQIAELLSEKLGGNTVTASTGKIGVALNMDIIASGAKQSMQKINKSTSNIIDFAEAILTTDLRIKISQDSKQNMLGFTKGSGMIHPNMATMLGFIISDIKITGLSEEETQEFFQSSLQSITEKTFNSISVDGDTSTNDMVIFMSNLQGREISEEEFKSSLEEVSKDLALQIINDGEGTSKIIESVVTGAYSESELRKIAKGIIGSNLVKSAIFGNDPNWGRIIAAAGQAAGEHNINLNPENCSLTLLDQSVYKGGMPVNQDKRNELSELMKKNKVIKLKLNITSEAKDFNQVVVWGSDLSYEYVRINAEYFT
jgi:glutamate N-acetyltransferase / amino-acid N-acetyltransferase